MANNMDEAWCVREDFNSVLHQADRIGGINIQAAEIKPFKDCISTCEVQEMRSISPYFTWTNKTIWTRIDRALVNTL